MLSPNWQTRIRLLQIADGALFAVSLAIAYFVRASFPFLDLPQIESFAQHLWLFPIMAVLGPLGLSSQGLYKENLAGRLNTIFTMMRALAFVTVALILLLFIVRVQFARSVIILACGFGGLLVYLRHEIYARIVARNSAQGQWRHRVLWVGDPDENNRLRNALTLGERSQLESLGDFNPLTQSAADLIPLLHEHSINAVIVNLSGLDTARLQPVLAACEREGVSVVVRPGFFGRSPSAMTVDWFAGEPVIHFTPQAAQPEHLVAKQLLDYSGAAILLLILSPVLFAVALATRLSSPGPILFRQERAGLNGRPFMLLKFRSMKVGAEQQQAKLASLNEMTGPVFKIANDPRVTALGRFLRRHSLDELPQLWNVVRGEMSLVGPRPLPVSEVKRFSDDSHRRRLSVRPGLTCLWQISGRNNISRFEDWVRLDLAYIDQWSLWLDAKILFGTIPVVLFGRGAR